MCMLVCTYYYTCTCVIYCTARCPFFQPYTEITLMRNFKQFICRNRNCIYVLLKYIVCIIFSAIKHEVKLEIVVMNGDLNNLLNLIELHYYWRDYSSNNYNKYYSTRTLDYPVFCIHEHYQCHRLLSFLIVSQTLSLCHFADMAKLYS